jgi:hypothetical protein
MLNNNVKKEENEEIQSNTNQTDESLYPKQEKVEPNLVGLQGWLTVVSLGLLINIIKLFGDVGEVVDYINSNYQSLPADKLFPVILAILLEIALTVIVVYNYALTKKHFPMVYIMYLLYQLEFLALDESSIEKVFGATIGSLFWILYMLRSKRVKNTFVN